MTNREVLIAMLQDKSKDSALKIYDKFFDVDSKFMKPCIFSTNTREQFAIELDKESPITLEKEVYLPFLVKDRFNEIEGNTNLKSTIEEDCNGYCIIDGGEPSYYPLSAKSEILSKYGKRAAGFSYFQGKYYVLELGKV